MCGDLDEDIGYDDDIMRRLTALAHRHGASGIAPTRDAPIIAGDRHAYMDALFSGLMANCLGDLNKAQEGRKAEFMASQAIVLARLAGMVAAHLPAQNDLLASVVDALMNGYREPVAGPGGRVRR